MTTFTFIAEIATILKKGSATHSYCEVWLDKTVGDNYTACY